jgi:hypothetical protein
MDETLWKMENSKDGDVVREETGVCITRDQLLSRLKRSAAKFSTFRFL